MKLVLPSGVIRSVISGRGREAFDLGCFVARQLEARRVGGPDRDLPEPGGGKPQICLSCSQILMHYYFACLSSHPSAFFTPTRTRRTIIAHPAQ